jgi:hypothetical protein
MEQQHPITPPPALAAKWVGEIYGDPAIPLHPITLRLVECAAQWGADQELEACVDWFFIDQSDMETAALLRNTRRPQPKTLKEQALEAARIELDPEGKNGALILRALEQLP